MRRMEPDEAHALLDRARDGENLHVDEITRALVATGDLPSLGGERQRNWRHRLQVVAQSDQGGEHARLPDVA